MFFHGLANKRIQVSWGGPRHTRTVPQPSTSTRERWRRWSQAPRVSALDAECVADRSGKRINMKAENGISRHRIMCPPTPVHDNSFFYSVASGNQSLGGLVAPWCQ